MLSRGGGGICLSTTVLLMIPAIYTKSQISLHPFQLLRPAPSNYEFETQSQPLTIRPPTIR